MIIFLIVIEKNKKFMFTKNFKKYLHFLLGFEDRQSSFCPSMLG